MSERANFRGGAGSSSTRGSSHHHSHHSRGGRGGRGGGGGGGGSTGHANTTTSTTNSNAGQSEKPKKENILDLGKYLNKEIRVKFNGGREGLWFFFPFIFSFHTFMIIGGNLGKEREGRLLCLSYWWGERNAEGQGIEKVHEWNEMANSKFGFTRDSVTGILKGHDQLMNLVLDDVMEVLHGKFDMVSFLSLCLLAGWLVVVYRSCPFRVPCLSFSPGTKSNFYSSPTPFFPLQFSTIKTMKTQYQIPNSPHFNLTSPSNFPLSPFFPLFFPTQPPPLLSLSFTTC